MSTMPQDDRSVKVEVLVDGAVYGADAWLSVRFEPIDGRYHWSGRLASRDGDAGVAGLAALVRQGRRDVRIRVVAPVPGHGPGLGRGLRGRPVPARLAEVDPWG